MIHILKKGQIDISLCGISKSKYDIISVIPSNSDCEKCKSIYIEKNK